MTLNMRVKKVSSKTNKNWLSNLSKSKAVTGIIASEAVKAKRKAEVKTSGAHQTGLQWHWGSTTLHGKWGDTVLIWPTTPMARKHPEYLRSAIRTTDFTIKTGGGN